VIEKDFIYEMDIEVADLDMNGVLKPNAYQSLFARLAEKHLIAVHLNIDKTLEFNLAWALVSMAFEIHEPVQGCIKLYATTWHSQRRGPYFRRELVFKNKNGSIMFQGSTFSVLLDVEARSVYRKKELPFHVHPPIEEFACTASPTYKGTSQMLEIERRVVRNSHIDWLGHMNNCKYGEFAHDLLTNNECTLLRRLSKMEIYFISELRNNDIFSLWKSNECVLPTNQTTPVDNQEIHTNDRNMTKGSQVIPDNNHGIRGANNVNITVNQATINNHENDCNTNPSGIDVSHDHQDINQLIHVRGKNESSGNISFDILLFFK